MVRALSLILALLAFAGPALAQGTVEERRARELYDNGAILYEEGRYEDAIQAWEEAYRISKRPLLLFNIANAQERIGQYRLALDSLNRYRAFAPADERDVLDRRMRNIERRLKEQEAEDEARRVEEEQAAAEQQEQAAADKQLVVVQKTPAARGPRPLLGVGIGLLGGGLAGAGAGAGLSGAALSARQEIEALCRDAAGTRYCPQSVEPLEADEAQYSLAGDIALIAGGAVAGTGLILMIVDSVTGGTTPVTVVPTPGGVAVAGRF
jgi:tetratricopeptide (TPR) repeat protein